MERYKKAKLILRLLSVMFSLASLVYTIKNRAQAHQKTLKERLADIRKKKQQKDKEAIVETLKPYPKLDQSVYKTPFQARIEKIAQQKSRELTRATANKSPLEKRDNQKKTVERKYNDEISPIVLAKFERDETNKKGLFIDGEIYFKFEWEKDTQKDREITNKIVDFRQTLEKALKNTFKTTDEQAYLKSYVFKTQTAFSEELFRRFNNIITFFKSRLKYYRALKDPTRLQRTTEAKIRAAYNDLESFALQYFSYQLPKL